ncbi:MULTISPECIES: hypothetical protein [Acidiphilium]|uniref:hypothetical protein n=1 Tax=Acidiphilium TaxID=522 RepID=UPI00257A83FC|nr:MULTISPECIES: hypothetical protein [Acidiphilium]HQT84233.1 hypothetical protein [Acidiphilium rubrum]
MGDATPQRRYERGENRRKHVGQSELPEIVSDGRDRIGKCPRGRAPEWRQGLLDDAVGYITVDPYSQEFPKRLFAVDVDGTIYTAQTSNPGDSYHGYPYAGDLGKRILKTLRDKAVVIKCELQFDAWVKQNIIKAGKPDI